MPRYLIKGCLINFGQVHVMVLQLNFLCIVISFFSGAVLMSLEKAIHFKSVNYVYVHYEII